MTARPDPLGRGLAFPIRVDALGTLAVVAGETHVAQSIALILLTAAGERAGLSRFGAGLDRFLMEPNAAGTHARMAEAIRTAIARDEPRVTLEGVSIEADPEAPDHARVTVTTRLVTSGAPLATTVMVRLVPGGC